MASPDLDPGAALAPTAPAANASAATAFETPSASGSDSPSRPPHNHNHNHNHSVTSPPGLAQIRRKPVSISASPLAVRFSHSSVADATLSSPSHIGIAIAIPDSRFAREEPLDSPTLYDDYLISRPAEPMTQ